MQLILWQDNLNKLVVGESYEHDQLIVGVFDELKFLTTPKSGQWTFKRCDDMEIIAIEDDDEDEVMLDVYVAGVLHVEMKASCLSCKASFTATGKVGKCPRCFMSQQLDRCCRSLLAKLLLHTSTTMEDNNPRTLFASLPMIRAITTNKSLILKKLQFNS